MWYNKFVSLFLFAVLRTATPQVTCPGLGDFNPEGPFVGWPDPTCPGDPDLELTFTMFQQGVFNGELFDRNTVPYTIKATTDNIKSGFIPTGDTVFIVHGYTSDGNTPWLPEMKDALVANIPNVNAVIVSWGGRSGSDDLYARSCSTTRTVGAELAEVMINLVQSGGGSTSLMHCTGHSLGSHVCGHFGRWAAGQGSMPARLTGMDPAGPNFDENPDRTVGIWTDCAEFVHIMHTDRSSGSTPDPGGNPLTLGHQDFYPNDGHDQPDCVTDSCSHSRVHALFTASITNGCFQATGSCTASNDLPGSCTPCTVCPEMGYFANPAAPQGIYRLDTSGSGDFCPV